MKHPTYQQAFKQGSRKLPKRARPYNHRKGSFLLTASFRTDVDAALINLAGKLTAHFTQQAIADLLGTSTSTIGKMVRCYFAQKSNYEVRNGKQEES